MQSKTIIFIVITVVLFTGLFILIKPEKESLKNYNPVVNSPLVSKEKVFELVVKDRKIVSGQNTLKVNEGDKVIIKITVDEDEELHLHGYDQSVDLEKDALGELVFTANLTGRFELELENSKTELGALEVFPK